ncbi:MAG: DUF4167 domain-containing protein [Pseudomonadota bacterium]
MRQQNHGRRSRNRGGNNRNRNQNPLQRSYESNGPDVKIRGNAQVIADKYAALARDAQSSGDRVMAENYLQHAEHYNRIILAAQPEKPKEVEGEEAAESETDGDQQQQAKGESQQPKVDADGPQPDIDGTPAEVAAEESEQPVAKKPRRPRRRKPVDAEAEAAPADVVTEVSEQPSSPPAEDTPVAAE